MPPQDSGIDARAIVTQINVLNSKVQLLIQRLKELEDKFSIISRTVIAHNNELKDLQSKPSTSESPFSRPSSSGSEELTQLKSDIENIKSEIKEMKYILDNVNPVSYVTVDEVADIVDQKLREKARK